MFWKITTCLFILLANPVLSAEQVETQTNSIQEEEKEKEKEQSEEYRRFHHYENWIVGGAIIAGLFAVGVHGVFRCLEKTPCVTYDGMRSETPLIEDFGN